MTEIISDQAIDRAEAFRLAKAFRLPPEIALNCDPEVLRFSVFLDCYGIGDSLICRRIRALKGSVGTMAAIAGSSASYADRLSHFTGRDVPVRFVDLRAVLSGPAGGGSPPDPISARDGGFACSPGGSGGAGDRPEGPSAPPAPGSLGPGGPIDGVRWGCPAPPERPGAYPVRRTGANPFRNPFRPGRAGI